jgi:hypothetical protein
VDGVAWHQVPSCPGTLMNIISMMTLALLPQLANGRLGNDGD